MVRFLKQLVLGLTLALLAPVMALAQTCAPPSAFQTSIPAGVINDYYQGSGQPTLNPGSTAITLGTRDTRGATTTLAVGDLLMIIQIQDGSYNTANNSTYGNGSGSGNGSTSLGSVGRYEWVRITGGTFPNITFTPALTNQYFDSDATASANQRRYQVVRVPQYTSGTAAGVVAPPWNGRTGGVVAMDVRGALTLGSGPVDGGVFNRAVFVGGKGFRGGLGLGSATDVAGTTTAIATWRMTSTLAAPFSPHASKGEGIHGTPRHVAVKNNNWGFQGTNALTAVGNLGSVSQAVEGYPDGSYARGAPGNAGGGGNDSDIGGTNQNNSGGGGGGNYGAGGIGGRPWNDPLIDIGGRGGASYAGSLAFNRIFMGGGGGAGSTNNETSDNVSYTNQGINCTLTLGRCSSGAAGGGIVVIRARSVDGSGTIDARGAHGYNVQNDSGGGAGAGGSVVLETVVGGNASIDVSGGDGGNAWAGSGGWPGGRHGPGGAGGGGFIAYAPNTMAISAAFAGGTPGETMNDAGFEEYYGGTGFNGGLTTFQTPNTPGVPQAALCDPNLQLRKSDGVTSLTSPGTTTFTFTVTNSGASATSGTISLADSIPTGLSVATGTLTLGGANAAQWTCNAPTTQTFSCTSTTSITGFGTSIFTIPMAINGANGLSVINRAQVSGGGDPNKTTTATPVTAATCTSNDTPLGGCAVDAGTIVAPSLSLTKTDGTTTVVPGQTLTYTLVVTNGGATPTTGTITIADLLPTGLTFNGASPFIMNSFTCSTVTGPGILCNRTVTLAASAAATVTFSVVVAAAPPSALTNRARVGGGGDPAPGKTTRPTTTTAAVCPAPVSPATEAVDDALGCASDSDAVLYARLDMTKDDGQVFVNRGGSTTYRFTIRNVGTAATVGTLTFGDILPTLGTGSITFTTAGTFNPPGPNGANWTCTRNTFTYTYCISTTSIPAGESSSFDLGVTVNATVPLGTQTLNRSRVVGGGDLVAGTLNTATFTDITSCNADGSPHTGCAIDLNTVQGAPEVRMTKSHPDPQARSPGDAFAFTLNVTNTGGAAAAANTVRVVDVLPAGLTFGTITPSAPFTCGAPVGQAVSCTNTAGALNTATSVNITVNVTVAAGATNTLVNRARVTASADPQNNTQTTTVTAALCEATDVPFLGCAGDPVPLNSDVRTLKEQRALPAGSFQTTLLGVNLAQTVQFRISAINGGPSAVSTVTFSDLIPFNFTSLSVGTATIGGSVAGCTATLAGSLLQGTATGMASGSTCSVVVQGVATTNTNGVTNTVAISIPSGISDTNTANNTATVVTAVGSANLSVSKTNNTTTLVAGSTTSYTITISNLGPSAADNTRVFDPVAPGLSCVTDPICTASGLATCPGGLTIGQLQNTTPPQGVAIPTLPSGGGITLNLTCTVTATGQ